MKKRWAMGLLCCLLLFQLAFPAKAAGSVYFVAAEESVLPVTDATMPFWANGYLYVPASVFTNLGISVINNTAKKMTVLEKDRRAMLFDWAKGTAQDSSGSLFTPGVIQSGGLVFVPASTVANFFGLQYSVTDVTNGYLVWLRSPDFGMSAKDFANAATYNMEERYNAYNRDATSSTTPNVPVTPSAPTRGARIHLCLEADQRTSGLLDALDRANGWATFYCTPDFLESNGEHAAAGWLPPVMRWAFWRRAARTRRSSCGGAMKPCTGPRWARPGWPMCRMQTKQNCKPWGRTVGGA